MLKILLAPLPVQKERANNIKNDNKNKNIKNKKRHSSSISTIDSNYSNRNSEFFGNIKNNKNINGDKKKKNIKININYINEFIEQLNIDRNNKRNKEKVKNNNVILPDKYKENTDNTQNKKKSITQMHKTYSLGNIYNNNFCNESIIKNKEKSTRDKNNSKKNIYMNKHNISLNGFIGGRRIKNKNKKNSIIIKTNNNSKYRKKFLNNSSENINKNKKNKKLDNNYLFIYKQIMEKNLKRSLTDLENIIKMYNDIQLLKEDSCHKMIYYNYLTISDIERTKKRINNSEKDKYNYENDEKLNERSMEINEQIIKMKEYTEIINKYMELLTERIKEDIEFNEKSRRNLYIYKNYALNGKEKYKNLELNTNYMKDVLKNVKDFVNK